jgi:hypothetical protein
VTDPWVGNGFERAVTTGVCHEVVGDRPVASGPAATAAIWSLSVSNGDLVTHIINIDKESDQIHPQRAAAPARPLLSPTSRESAQTGSLARRRRRQVWLGPRNERRDTSFRGPIGSTWHDGRSPTHF